MFAYKKKIVEYEGEYAYTRGDELLPGLTYFFVFKNNKVENSSFEWRKALKSVPSKIKETFSATPKAEVNQEIVSKFLLLTMDEAAKRPISDDSLDIMEDWLAKIKEIPCDDLISSLTRATHQRIKSMKKDIDYQQLFYLIIVGKKLNTFTPELRNILFELAFDYSNFLHHLLEDCNFKRNEQTFVMILEEIAWVVGSNYWWLLFRVDRQERLETIAKEEAIAALIDTLITIPHVLLAKKVFSHILLLIILLHILTCS